MIPSSDKSKRMAIIPWILAGGFLFSNGLNILINQSRLLVFFTIIAFWYGFSLYIRRRVYKDEDGTTHYGALNYFGYIYYRWYTVLAFGIFLLPTTFLTILGILYAIKSTLSVETTLVLTTILWMIFFTFESSRSQGHHLSNLSELNWFVVLGIFLDLIGIISIFIDLTN